MACQLCAGVTGTEALKILLKRGPLYPAPYYHQFDAYRCRWHVGFLPGGNRHPLQFLKRRMGYQSVARLSPPAALETFAAPLSEMEQILDLARWAPSGDNSQPWRFEILSPQRLVVHVRDQAAEDVYDYNQGQPTLLSCGLLLETMGIAASRHKYSLRWEYTRNQGNRHRIEVELRRDEQVVEDPLLPYIPLRSVNRRPFRTLPLNPAQKQWLERSAGPEFTLTWHESWQERLQIARLNALATDIRLRIPEAYRVHQKILDWDRHFSPDGVPARAIGLDPLTLKVMRWALRDWSRMQRLNRLPGATFGARLQMDYLPGLQCATHFSMARTQNPAPADQGPALLRAGQAWQRFWLTATRLGLALQPGMAPLIFAYHARHGIPFTSEVPLRRKAEELDTKLRKSWAGDPDHLLFRGRLGWPKSRQVTARSFRRPLAELLQPWDEPQTNKEG
jgi:nitroreductase